MVQLVMQRWLLVCALMTAGLTASGCSDPYPVRQYTVAKPVAADAFTPSPGAPQSPIVARRSAWFFKLLGPEAAVASQAEAFSRLVRGVDFTSDGNPRWTLPEGWNERRETGLRFATIEVPGDPRLEISVSSLPAADPTSAEYLLSNINRWRGQLELGPINDAEGLAQSREKGELEQLEAGGRKLSLVNLSGKTAEHGDARMLVAILTNDSTAAGSGATAAAPSPSTSAVADKPFTYTLPWGWTEAPLKMFQLASFTAGEGSEKLAISVSTAGGDLAGNVNRWRQQVGLPSVSSSDVTAAAREVAVGGTPGKYFVVEGTSDAILGVIAERAGVQWFIKATGPKSVIEKERSSFEEFVRSLRFKE
jgi:hypothetical protein